MGYGRLFSSDGKYMGQVSNFYRKVDGNKMHIEMDNGRSLIFNPGDLLRDKQGDWHIRSMPDFYNLADIVDEAFKREALYHRGDARKEEPSMNAGSIKNVIFNPPATVVYWTDGTKTVVKCNENDIFDLEKGLALGREMLEGQPQQALHGGTLRQSRCRKGLHRKDESQFR